MSKKDMSIDKLIEKIVESNTSFTHYGVPGMRWGHRVRGYVPVGKRKSGGRLSQLRNKISGGKGRSRGNATTQNKPIRVKIRKKSVKEMSNKELQDRVNRMNLEKQYKRLNPTKTERFLKFVEKPAKEVAESYTKSYLDKRVGEIIQAANKQNQKANEKR